MTMAVRLGSQRARKSRSHAKAESAAVSSAAARSDQVSNPSPALSGSGGATAFDASGARSFAAELADGAF